MQHCSEIWDEESLLAALDGDNIQALHSMINDGQSLERIYSPASFTTWTTLLYEVLLTQRDDLLRLILARHANDCVPILRRACTYFDKHQFSGITGIANLCVAREQSRNERRDQYRFYQYRYDWETADPPLLTVEEFETRCRQERANDVRLLETILDSRQITVEKAESKYWGDDAFIECVPRTWKKKQDVIWSMVWCCSIVGNGWKDLSEPLVRRFEQITCAHWVSTTLLGFRLN
jgi:hypothetical protein